MQEMIVRAVLGGIVVSSFALLGDVLKPKSFAGLFGAAPSVALATLALAVHMHGAGYARIEAKSMLLGAIAFFVYASVASRLMKRQKWAALPVTALALLVWLAVALGMERLLA
jgi:uncharacterized membrane protein (GlpM family)